MATPPWGRRSPSPLRAASAACLLLALLAAAAAYPAAVAGDEVAAAAAQPERFHGSGKCPRACRSQQYNTAAFCRMCAGCAGYKSRCRGCNGPPPPVPNAYWPLACQRGSAAGAVCLAACSGGYTGSVKSTCTTGGWSTPTGVCTNEGSCSVASQCPAPENGQPLCQSGRCDIACNNNFLKAPNPSGGAGFICTPVQPIGSLDMPGKFSVWVGGFSTVAGFNGERWDFRYPDATIFGLALASPDYAIAVGGPKYYIFNQGTWTAYTTPSAYLYGATTGPESFWLVGANGTAWTVDRAFTQTSGQVPGVSDTLIGVASTGRDTAVAVGERGTIVSLVGTNPAAWTKVASPTTRTLNAIVSGAGALWAVGNGGTILVNKGSGWVRQRSESTKDLFDVTVVSDSLAWAVGKDGTILKFTGAGNGAVWTVVPPLNAMDLYAVRAWSADYALAFGQGSIVLAYDGGEWKQASYPGIGIFYTVAALPTTAREGRRLLQTPDMFQLNDTLTPNGRTTCTDERLDPVSVMIIDPAYIPPEGSDGFVDLPICPSGDNLLRCKVNDGTVLCDQNVNYTACQWKASGGEVTSAKCNVSAPFCGVISGDRPRYNAIAGVTADGTPYKLDASQNRVLLTKAEPEADKEKRILLEAKSILIGDTSRPNSTTLDTWNVSTPPCGGGPGFTTAWSGIKCNDGSIEEIELPGKLVNQTRLQGKLPDNFSQLKRLTAIKLPSNNFADTKMPESWGNLSRLVELDLSGNNRIRGTLPAFWSNLKNLASLNLAGCRFFGTLPSEWGQLRCFVDTACRPTADSLMLNKSISAMDLSGNLFNGSIPASWGNWLNINKLNLAKNKLTGTLPAFFGRFPFLSELGLSTNNFAGSLPREWATMGSALRTDNTVFAGLIPIGALSDTSVIRVAENRISGSVPSEWGNMQPRNILALSLFSNAGLTGCLPRPWFLRRAFSSFNDTLFNITQMYANEDPLDTTQPQIVSCKIFNANGTCYLDKPRLRPDEGVLRGTKITGWCP